MKFTSRKIVGIFLVLITGLLSLVAWRLFFIMLFAFDLSHTLQTLLAFSLLSIGFLLGTIVWRERMFQLSGGLALFLPSLIFIHTWYHFVLVAFAVLLSLLASIDVQKEVKERVVFHFFKNIRAGSSLFILSLVFVLSSGYFASIRTESWEDLVPRFQVGEGTASVIFRGAAYFYPEFKQLSQEGITVDEFLDSLEQTPQNIKDLASPSYNSQSLSQDTLSDGRDIALIHELYLRTGREQIAQLVGQPVVGNEKIADIFSTAIQYKIIASLRGQKSSQHVSPQIVPLVLAVLLFLTLLPLGTLLSFPWIFLGFLLFRLLLALHVLELVKLPREQETLAE